jgi:hypothetical protein
MDMNRLAVIHNIHVLYKKGEVLVAFVSENDIMAKVAVFSPRLAPKI